ncbi:hypothetical protein D3C86_2076960 [compost metagenome]
MGEHRSEACRISTVDVKIVDVMTKAVENPRKDVVIICRNEALSAVRTAKGHCIYVCAQSKVVVRVQVADLVQIVHRAQNDV